MTGQIPLIVARDEKDHANCPTCGMAVRVVRRVYDGEADHYVANMDWGDIGKVLPPQDPITAAKLKALRQGKKTAALVGMAPTSCSLAPFDDESCEIWGLNEAHSFPWMKRANRWFQIHETAIWKRYIAKRDVRGHADWLKKNPLDVPIYMQFWHELVPKSVGYPLHEVIEKYFRKFWRGDKNDIKYFTSTFAYMMGVALLEDFTRIEIYGFEMADDEEWRHQKACAEFWIGLAMGRDVEIYTPPGCQLLFSNLYGGDDQGAGWGHAED